MFSSYKQLLLEAESQLDHDRLIALINSLTDGFLAVDETGTIELSNSVALSLLDANVLKGKNLYQVLHLVDKTGGPVDLRAKLKEKPSGFTARNWQLNLGDNELINLYINVSPVRVAFAKKRQSGYVIILRDITKDKTKEDERDEFISVASHELRTPVTIAEGNLSNAIVAAQSGHQPDSIIQSLKTAHQQLIFLESLINDLAMLSRADRTKLASALEEVDVIELINGLIADYKPQASKKGLEVFVNLPGNIPKIFSSKLYLREIMQNLISNAIKYTEQGRIMVNVSFSSGVVGISVSDTGIGTDSNEKPKLFTKFFRSEDSRVRQMSGTGLGLYVSAKLAKLLGGYIDVDSELNKGSVYSLYLPSSAYHPISNQSS